MERNPNCPCLACQGSIPLAYTAAGYAPEHIPPPVRFTVSSDFYRFVRFEGDEALVVVNDQTLRIIPAELVPEGTETDDIFEIEK